MLGLPGFVPVNKRTIRAPVNPMDKSTVFSIYPREILQFNPTIQPGKFLINPGTYENPSLLVVGPSSWWRDIDEDQPLLEIPTSSIQIADSIVKDFCNGIFACDMSISMPGVFYIPGEQTLVTLRKSFQAELDKAVTRQRSWYTTLIKLADALWARSNGNPLAISDDMRMAAKELHQEKDWMKQFQMVDMARCKACGSLRNSAYPICPTCKVIDDPVKAKEMGLVFAQ